MTTMTSRQRVQNALSHHRWNLIAPVAALKLVALPLLTAALVAGSNLLPWPALHLSGDGQGSNVVDLGRDGGSRLVR